MQSTEQNGGGQVVLLVQWQTNTFPTPPHAEVFITTITLQSDHASLPGNYEKRMANRIYGRDEGFGVMQSGFILLCRCSR